MFSKSELPLKDIKILDACCGTGLVGIELKKNGFKRFFKSLYCTLLPLNLSFA